MEKLNQTKTYKIIAISNDKILTFFGKYLEEKGRFLYFQDSKGVQLHYNIDYIISVMEVKEVGDYER